MIKLLKNVVAFLFIAGVSSAIGQQITGGSGGGCSTACTFTSVQVANGSGGAGGISTGNSLGWGDAGLYRVSTGLIGVNTGGMRFNDTTMVFGGTYAISWYTGGAFAAVANSLNTAATGVLSVEAASAAGGTYRSTPTSPAQIAADQNNYNPGGSSIYQRWNTDASRTVTGLTFTAAQVTGQTHVIVNAGANALVLAHQSASSTVANRFLNSTGADITLSADQAADIFYDGTTARWRVYKRN